MNVQLIIIGEEGIQLQFQNIWVKSWILIRIVKISFCIIIVENDIFTMPICRNSSRPCQCYVEVLWTRNLSGSTDYMTQRTLAKLLWIGCITWLLQWMIWWVRICFGRTLFIELYLGRRARPIYTAEQKALRANLIFQVSSPDLILIDRCFPFFSRWLDLRHFGAKRTYKNQNWKNDWFLLIFQMTFLLQRRITAIINKNLYKFGKIES